MMPNLGLTDFCESLKGQGKKLLLDAKHNNEFADRVCVKKRQKETFVGRLATGICTVWNDNPKAF